MFIAVIIVGRLTPQIPILGNYRNCLLPFVIINTLNTKRKQKMNFDNDQYEYEGNEHEEDDHESEGYSDYDTEKLKY